MSIDTLSQGGAQVILPEQLQNAIEHARNNVTILESEASRLQKLAQDSKNIVEAKHLEKINLDSQLLSVKTQLDSTLDILAKRTVELQALDQKLATANENLGKTQDKTTEIEKQNVKVKADLDARETAVKNNENALSDRHVELLKKEGDHAARVEKLKKALE